MGIQVITHEIPSWQKRKRYENGAATYSRDIVNTQLHHLLDYFSFEPYKGKNVIISTCPLISELSEAELKYKKPDIIIQYLHSFPYDASIEYIKDIIKKSRFPNKNQWWFITAYKSFADLINASGFRATFIPMMIDTSEIPEPDNHQNMAVWFGNIYPSKKSQFKTITSHFKKAGIKMSVISKGRLNSKRPVSQKDAFEIIRKYKYGVGVGRCALEMYKMGLKVLVMGAEFGGIVMNDDDALTQLYSNFNGRVITWNRNIEECIDMLQYSHSPEIPSISEINHLDFIKEIDL